VAEVAHRAALTPTERALVTPHAFRHTVATVLARNHHLVVAADVLSHASLTTTRCYVKATAVELETAVDQLCRTPASYAP
jgi:integrase